MRVNESLITSESCFNESTTTVMTNTSTTTRTTTSTIATTTTTDEDYGFESQPSKLSNAALASNARPLTSAVNEWLKRSNSPGLFVTSSDNVSNDEDSDDSEIGG